MLHIIKFYTEVRAFIQKIGNDNVSAFAAQSSYFIIISFFPFMMLLLTLIQFTPVTQSELLRIAVSICPDTIDSLVISIINELYSKASSTGTIISITAITAVWSAARGILYITRGLNSVNEIKETRNYIVLRCISALHTIIFLLIILFTLIILVFGNSLQNFISLRFPVAANISGFIISIRSVVSLCLLALFFMLIYKELPNKKSKYLNQMPGALFSAGGWMLFSFAYSFYIDNYSKNFSYMYGSLTTFVFALLWLYFCMYILFIGAEINIYIEKEFHHLKWTKKKDV
jgi:membrane protein